MLSNIRIVLVKTFHPGNIGAAARALKNMGLSELVLVDPVDFPSDEAYSRAGQATDILDKARVVHSLDEALADCELVIATSARERAHGLPILDPEEAALESIQTSARAPVAIVFGRERMGLLNEEIQKCHKHLVIPAAEEYPVLNIAQAIQVVTYELFKAQQVGGTTQQTTEVENDYPLHKELEHFYSHLEAGLAHSGFLGASHKGETMLRLRTLFRRARPSRKELNILYGIVGKLKP